MFEYKKDGTYNFYVHFVIVISHHKKIGCSIKLVGQIACFVVTVYNFAFFFNCTSIGRTSDSLMVQASRLIYR